MSKVNENTYYSVDPLTGVYTRKLLEFQLQHEAERATRYNTSFSLVVLDLDHFKSVNDAFGHSRGDEILVEFAGRLKNVARASDYVFRYGGDEFLVLLPNTNKSQAFNQAARVLEVVGNTPFSGDPPINLSLSIGVASFPEDAQNLKELFEKADARAYFAKRTGRNRIVNSDPVNSLHYELDQSFRLIERDDALKTFQEFIEAFNKGSRKGTLLVSGEPGSGISRFLLEIEKLLALRGWGSLYLQTSNALKNRYFGALIEPFSKLGDVASEVPSDVTFTRQLKEWVISRKLVGVVILVDDWTRLDRASQDFLQRLLTDPSVPTLALVYSTGNQTAMNLPEVSGIKYKLELTPLSQEGVKIWLRYGLKSEPSQNFLEWFYDQTAGLPRQIDQGLKYLLNAKVLKFVGDSWELPDDDAGLNLAQLTGLATPHNLPENLTPVVGRQESLRQLHALLKTNRLVTIIGPGGIGKTRLALQIGAELLESFREGVYFISLAGIERVNYVIPAICEGVGLKLQGSQSPLSQLARFLKEKHVLLILDNFEQLLEDSSLLVQLTTQAPLLKVLVTSRERLDLPFEATLAIKGLNFPLTDDAPGFEAYSAVQLFVQSVNKGQSSYPLQAEDRTWLVRLFNLLEGMPLGIELAAAWVDSVPLSQIVRELEQDTGFYVAGETKGGRQQSLAPALDWFWNRLARHEQMVLRRLAIFRGGFEAKAAVTVAGASPFFLDALVAKFFLTRINTRRYNMHELLRQYAEQKSLAGGKETQLGHSQHCRYFVRQLEQKAQALSKGHKIELEEITTELENVRVAWQWAISNRRQDLIGRSARGLARYYAYKGFNSEGEQAITAGINALRSLSPNYEVQLVQARLMVELAYFLKERSSFKQLSEVAREAFELAGATAQPRLQAESLLRWGSGLMWQGEREKAHQLFDQGLKLARQARLPFIEADLLRSLGLLYDMNANYPLSIEYAEKSLKLSCKIGYRIGECATLANLGEAYMQQGDYSGALPNLELALATAREIDYPLIQTNASECLGKLWMFVGDYERSKEYLTQGLSLARETGNNRLAADCLSSLGLLLHLMEDNQAAYQYNLEALKIVVEQGNLQYEAYTRTYLGHVFTALGKTDDARQNYRLALDIRQKLEQKGKATEPLAGLVRLDMSAGDWESARAGVEEILHQIDTGQLDGVSEPLRVYLTCYEALQAMGDPRAGQILNKARCLLDRRANLLNNEHMRRCFLEKIRVHVCILHLSGSKS